MGHRGHGKKRGLFLFLLKRKRQLSIRNRIFVHLKIASTVKRVVFVSERVSYVVLRGRWCNIIVLNVHAQSEENSDDSKDSFCEKLEQVFKNNFPKYHIKILLGGFNEKWGTENIFKQTIGNESLHQDRNDNGVRIVKFGT